MQEYGVAACCVEKQPGEPKAGNTVLWCHLCQPSRKTCEADYHKDSVANHIDCYKLSSTSTNFDFVQIAYTSVVCSSVSRLRLLEPLVGVWGH